jgi:hypothetical protein
MDSSCDKFAENGFAIVRNVFSRQEVADFRKLVYRQAEEDAASNQMVDDWEGDPKVGRGDLLCKPHLWRILLDPRIVAIARQLLPPNPIVYFGDSVYQLGNGGAGFHRDNIDRLDLAGPDWRDDPYPLLRMGIYLQDHRRHSGGLKVKVGSHLRKDGRPFIVDSEPGDVVVWHLRTLHSGQTVRLRAIPNFPWIPPTRHLRRLKIGAEMLPKWMVRPLEQQRAVLFMSFGAESRHLDRYISEYLEKAEEPRKRMKASRFGREVWDEAERLQVTIRRIVPEYGTPRPIEMLQSAS